MKTIKARLGLAVLCGAVAALTLAPQAKAFYPWGFFDANGNLVYIKWGLDYMDTNGDGDITGTNEGIELHFEGGDNGFTDEEISELKIGFETWEAVSTSYAAFWYGQDISDPVELTDSIDNIDFINMVAIQVAEDDYQVEIGAHVNPFITNTYEATTITVGQAQVSVPKGRIIECDMVFAGEVIRALEDDEGYGFRGNAVLGAGGMLGLGNSPIENFDEAASEAAGRPIEKRVVWLRGASGTLEKVGVTPSLYNGYFFYDEGNDLYTDAIEDLAPDDIAGITFLYPRSNSDKFFDLSQMARSQTIEGYPSRQLAGAYITAWCDVDNNSGTGRVPFIDTLTGLYENSDSFQGKFILRNLFKQLEDAGGVTFSPSYAITCQEFDPPYFEKEDFDTTHFISTGAGTASYSGLGFDTQFPSEVFREGDNIFGVDNVNQGSSLYFDLQRRKIVNADTGNSLDAILAGGLPMFGDGNSVCPLNVVVAGLGPSASSDILRHFRDGFLLDNAVGVALVDAYYRAAPSMAEFLLRHQWALTGTQFAVRGLDWVVGHAEWLAALLAGLIAIQLVSHRRRARAAALLIVGLSLTLFAAPAQARWLYDDIEGQVADADAIVAGKVTAADSHWTSDGKKIVTDISIEVDDVVTGKLNKGGMVHFTLPIGRVGAIGRSCAQLPTFREGEEVLLILRDKGKHGIGLVGGRLAKYTVRTDEESGQKYVYAGDHATKIRLAAALKKMDVKDEDSEESGESKVKDPKGVLLEDFKDYLRDVDREQKEAKKAE